MKYGIADDVNDKFNKYEKLLHYTFDNPGDHISILIEKKFNEVVANVCKHTLQKFIASKMVHYYQISIFTECKFKNSLILVNEKSINLIKSCIELF